MSDSDISPLTTSRALSEREVMKRASKPITFIGRFALMLIGLGLADEYKRSNSVSGWLVSIAGVVLFLAAIGAIEVGMAVWYRVKRHRLSPR